MRKKVLKGKHIFISYIEENKEIAHIIWDELDRLGAVPWAYTKNDDANRWRKEIVRSIRNSDIMILVFSNKTDENADKQIVREIGLASKNGLEIIPFMIDDIHNIENEDLAYELEGINWIRNTKPIEKQIEKLIERICRHYGIVLETSKEGTLGEMNPYVEEADKESKIKDTPKKSLWIKWLLRSLFFLFVMLFIGVIGTKYILSENRGIGSNDINFDESEMISPELKLRVDEAIAKNDKGISEEKNDFFVCYEKNILNNGDISYVGCIKKNNSCTKNNLKYFGKYKIKIDQDKALTRCVNSTPHAVYNAKVYGLKNAKDSFLVLRENPSGTLIAKLFNGEKLGVLEEKDKWLKVKIQKSGQIGWVYGKWVKETKLIKKDETILSLENSIMFGTINAKVITFGGNSTPECRFAVSLDGQYFYYTKLDSTCVRLENSKKVNIVCNSDKSICKTRMEIIDFIKKVH